MKALLRAKSAKQASQEACKPNFSLVNHRGLQVKNTFTSRYCQVTDYFSARRATAPCASDDRKQMLGGAMAY